MLFPTLKPHSAFLLDEQWIWSNFCSLKASNKQNLLEEGGGDGDVIEKPHTEMEIIISERYLNWGY